MQTPSKVRLIILTILFTTVTYFTVGDSAVRLATANRDDHPVIFSRFLKNPTAFEGDILSSYGYQMAYSSLPSWSTALLERTVGLPPTIAVNLMVWVQNVLLVLATSYFVFLLTSEASAALLTPIALYAAKSWSNNLAWYPSVLHSPYPGQLVLPFLLIALTALLKKHFHISFFVLCLAAIIHPLLTLYTVTIVGLYLFSRLTQQQNALFPKLISLIFVIILCIAPGIICVKWLGNPDRLANHEVLRFALASAHITPWQTDVFWGWHLPTFVGLFLSALWVSRHLKHGSPELRTLVTVTALTTVAFALLHIGAVALESVIIMQAIPLRMTTITSLIFMPLIFAYLFNKSKAENPTLRICAFTSIFLFASAPTGFFWGALLPLFVDDTQKRTPRKTAKIIFVLWAALFLLCGRPFRSLGLTTIANYLRPILVPGGSGDAYLFAFCLFFGVVIGNWRALGKKLRLPTIPIPAITATILSLLLLKSLYPEWKEIKGGYSQGMYKAQAWAAEHSPPTAIFITGTHFWRGVSSRRAVLARRETFAPHLYTRTRKTMEFGDNLEAFYRGRNAKDFEDLTEMDVLQLAKEFGGDFVVRSVSTPLKLPEVYRNQWLIIYQLNKL